ncbi:MarR family winged helix-turn-helix transcriptional regulator [Acetobacter vaccinii]|uniref:MarR family transcriptional regulator n=1 Tax=Acetobacter vaccinii TaxID=2592655 RepID=A0A5C1YJN7_9PROT|nr:MarR family transcriptional regulator [Acetobacter vaccinii]QEO16456.1 MarR family transcriptional regulator [Acetobacter vaccinii]
MIAGNQDQKNQKDARLRSLHGALLDVMGMLNGVLREEMVIREAGIRLDRTLFPLLALVDRCGPVGVVELAERVGRDYTTVSRQLAKLESLALVVRRCSTADRRSRQAVITSAGHDIVARIDAACEQVLGNALQMWTEQEKDSLVQSLHNLANSIRLGE